MSPPVCALSCVIILLRVSCEVTAVRYASQMRTTMSTINAMIDTVRSQEATLLVSHSLIVKKDSRIQDGIREINEFLQTRSFKISFSSSARLEYSFI